ncbi:hypothetical protein NG99_04710 [Erwinia typographi]|uniref:Gp11 C-terminal domain-containing protein n=1 Tax=Erwinia typographi TaxID=371042 RepID=A0A0A4ABX7_9GAMM|nr:hypothetical protein [Erwinia typographi]KGT95323.1 hypothetical protein NG99_04710 [Erwinia typographi]
MNSFNWVEGNGDIPDEVLDSAYETGAGKAICAVCEVSDELVRQGWPRLTWAFVDVPIRTMICRSTRQNISQYVVRWLPVDGAVFKEPN